MAFDGDRESWLIVLALNPCYDTGFDLHILTRATLRSPAERTAPAGGKYYPQAPAPEASLRNFDWGGGTDSCESKPPTPKF